MKSSVAGYGLIIAVVLTSLVIMAMATPLGLYISDAIINITRGATQANEAAVSQGYEQNLEEFSELFEVQKNMSAGLYDYYSNSGKLLYDWNTLTENGTIEIVKDIETDAISIDIKRPEQIKGCFVVHRAVDIIHENSFLNCAHMSSIVLKDVLLVETDAFSGCLNLDSIIIQENTLKGFEEDALSGCAGLKAIYFNGTYAEFQEIAFGKQDLSQTIYVYCIDKTVKIKFQ